MGQGSIPWMKILRTEIHCSSNCRACVRGFGHQARRGCNVSSRACFWEARRGKIICRAMRAADPPNRSVLRSSVRCHAMSELLRQVAAGGDRRAWTVETHAQHLGSEARHMIGRAMCAADTPNCSVLRSDIDGPCCCSIDALAHGNG